MIFPNLLPPDENFSVLKRESSQGLWILGIRQMMYGQRVCLSRAGEQWYAADYCCADDANLLAEVHLLLSIILAQFDETISSRELEKRLPRGIHKPINRDPVLAKLQEMAGVTAGTFTVCGGCGRADYSGKDFCCGANNASQLERNF